MADTHYQVLVVGGGIVGLCASLFLSAHNIPHLLVERHSGTSIHPRARGVNTRTMEIFRSIQIDEAVREAGAELAPSLGIYKGSSFVEVMESRPRRDSEKRGEMPFANTFDTASPSKGARCTQDMLEPVLVKIARERGGQLRFYTNCEKIEQDEKGVTATLLDRESNMVSQVHANYLIAADGAGSPVRKKLGVATTGKGAFGNLLNILFHADLRDLVRGREMSICTIEQPGLRGYFTSVNNSDRWVFHLSYDHENGEKATDYTPEYCQHLLRLAIGIPEIEIDVKSILPWQPSDLVAERLQQGRIFLAGDAAHQVTPYAGQGATSGIADVYDLAWKLGLVLKSQASEKLLETYEIERLPVGRFVARESGEIADKYGLPNMKTFRGFLKMIMRIPMIAGFGYQYASHAIIPEEPAYSSWTSWWFVPWSIPSLVLGLNGKPGTRAPHVWVRHQGQQISTLDLFGKSFVLLTGSEGKLWCQAASDVASKIGVDLQAYRIGPTGDLSDPNGLWESAASISTQGALLVRPDGFVAWRVQDQQGSLAERFREVMEKILCR